MGGVVGGASRGVVGNGSGTIGVAGRDGKRTVFTTGCMFFSDHFDELALVINAIVIK
jgi:hypothetical protein